MKKIKYIFIFMIMFISFTVNALDDYDLIINTSSAPYCSNDLYFETSSEVSCYSYKEDINPDPIIEEYKAKQNELKTNSNNYELNKYFCDSYVDNSSKLNCSDSSNLNQAQCDLYRSFYLNDYNCVEIEGTNFTNSEYFKKDVEIRNYLSLNESKYNYAKDFYDNYKTFRDDYDDYYASLKINPDITYINHSNGKCVKKEDLTNLGYSESDIANYAKYENDTEIVKGYLSTCDENSHVEYKNRTTNKLAYTAYSIGSTAIGEKQEYLIARKGSYDPMYVDGIGNIDNLIGTDKDSKAYSYAIKKYYKGSGFVYDVYDNKYNSWQYFRDALRLFLFVEDADNNLINYSGKAKIVAFSESSSLYQSIYDAVKNGDYDTEIIVNDIAGCPEGGCKFVWNTINKEYWKIVYNNYLSKLVEYKNDYKNYVQPSVKVSKGWDQPYFEDFGLDIFDFGSSISKLLDAKQVFEKGASTSYKFSFQNFTAVDTITHIQPSLYISNLQQKDSHNAHTKSIKVIFTDSVSGTTVDLINTANTDGVCDNNSCGEKLYNKVSGVNFIEIIKNNADFVHDNLMSGTIEIIIEFADDRKLLDAIMNDGASIAFSDGGIVWNDKNKLNTITVISMTNVNFTRDQNGEKTPKYTNRYTNSYGFEDASLSYFLLYDPSPSSSGMGHVWGFSWNGTPECNPEYTQNGAICSNTSTNNIVAYSDISLYSKTGNKNQNVNIGLTSGGIPLSHQSYNIEKCIIDKKDASLNSYELNTLGKTDYKVYCQEKIEVDDSGLKNKSVEAGRNIENVSMKYTDTVTCFSEQINTDNLSSEMSVNYNQIKSLIDQYNYYLSVDKFFSSAESYSKNVSLPSGVKSNAVNNCYDGVRCVANITNVTCMDFEDNLEYIKYSMEIGDFQLYYENGGRYNRQGISLCSSEQKKVIDKGPSNLETTSVYYESVENMLAKQNFGTIYKYRDNNSCDPVDVNSGTKYTAYTYKFNDKYNNINISSIGGFQKINQSCSGVPDANNVCSQENKSARCVRKDAVNDYKTNYQKKITDKIDSIRSEINNLIAERDSLVQKYNNATDASLVGSYIDLTNTTKFLGDDFNTNVVGSLSYTADINNKQSVVNTVNLVIDGDVSTTVTYAACAKLINGEKNYSCDISTRLGLVEDKKLPKCSYNGTTFTCNEYYKVNNTKTMVGKIIRTASIVPENSYSVKKGDGKVVLTNSVNGNKDYYSINGLPVSGNVPTKNYGFGIELIGAGNFFGSNSRGRYDGKLMTYSDIENTNCGYKVTCKDCPIVTENPPGCTSSNCPITTKPSFNLIYRIISSLTLNPNDRDIGVNWTINNTSIGRKANITINEIKNSYSNEVFTVDMTSSLSKYIRENFKVNQYDLKCYDVNINGETYYGVMCYSQVIDELVDKYSKNLKFNPSRPTEDNRGNKNEVYTLVKTTDEVDKPETYWTIFTDTSDIGPSWK